MLGLLEESMIFFLKKEGLIDNGQKHSSLVSRNKNVSG